VDAYLFKNNGNPIMKKGTEFESQPADNMWKDRDDRFELSIIHDNSDVFGATFNFKLGGNQQRGMPGVGNPSFSGYFFKKWLYESITHGVYAWTPAIDWGQPILRLGEVYLNTAEAYARKNDLSNAVKYLNKTRTSHGGLAPLVATSMIDFWKYYKIERRVEMVYENDRYWSLVRWSRADGNTPINELNGYLTFINLYQHADGLVRVESTQGGDYRGPLKFEIPKRYFFPIPNSEIQNNKKLKQNPGY
jgi:starch-binding outer membrane protein, SusD/RagB family